MVKNHVHWPSRYLKAFRNADLAVVDCAEPQIDIATVEKINPSSTTKHWMKQALLGLPFALIWELERSISPRQKEHRHPLQSGAG